MATLPELLAQAEIIRTAQNVDENTAQRIGKLYNDIIVYFSNNGGTGGVTSHLALSDKNAETTYQHVDTTTTKETLVEDDKVTIYDSETGEVVLTDKSNIIPSHNALSNRNGEDKFRHVDLLYTKQTLLENDKLVVWDSNTNEVTLAKKSSISHRDINYKNSETAFQHVDTTTTKETLVEDDKVAIYDSVTGKVVLTDKSNVGAQIDDEITSTTKVWSSQKISTVIDTKQDTLLGTIKKRSYTIDFNTHSELAQDSNLLGEITINRILTKNVTELYVSYGSVVRQQVPTSGTVSLSIPDETVLVWEIVRATEGELACVGIRFEILMEE